ncbi:MAG: T9SS type A sorting domain-containing protein [Chitinophagales bacterium]
MAQTAPTIQWQKCYGGSDDEVYYSLEATSDHGFFLIGDTKSTDGDVVNPPAGMNSWVAKIDYAGMLQWQNAIGGSAPDHSYSGQQTSDLGYIVGVESLSSDGDAGENHGGYDFLCTRLNETGDLVWTHDYGGSLHDHPSCIRKTQDGGYIMSGGSLSNDGDVTGHHGSTSTFDIWLMKLDSSGNSVWSKSIGGTQSDFGLYIQQTSDGNYILVGQSQSNDGDITGHHGSPDTYDLLVMKFNSKGKILWQKSFGGSGDDMAHCVKQTIDGGYIIAASTESSDGDVMFNHGGKDLWILKLGPNGKLLWQKTYGGSKDEGGRSIQQTMDGGYIAAGETTSNDGDVTGNHGNSDYWLIKIDAKGNLQWQETLGGSGFDFGKTVLQLKDGSFIVGGNSFSNDGDVSGLHGSTAHGDYWIVKLNAQGVPPNCVVCKTQNSSKEKLVDIFLYPIPAHSLVTVEVITKNPLEGTLELRDMNNQLLFQQEVNYAAGTFRQTLDLSNYSAGTYYVGIRSREQFVVRKIEKQ